MRIVRTSPIVSMRDITTWFLANQSGGDVVRAGSLKHDLWIPFRWKMVLVCFGFNVQSNFIRYYKIIGFYHWCSNGGQQNFISFFWPVSPELCHSFTPFFRRSPMLDPAASTLLLKMAGKSPTSASRCESQVELSGIDMIWLVVWLPLFIFPEILGC